MPCSAVAVVRVYGCTPAVSAIPLPEHPRPDWERPQWVNLKRQWDFGIEELADGMTFADFHAKAAITFLREATTFAEWTLNGWKQRGV